LRPGQPLPSPAQPSPLDIPPEFCRGFSAKIPTFAHIS
jgi:hypothetical protein